MNASPDMNPPASRTGRLWISLAFLVVSLGGALGYWLARLPNNPASPGATSTENPTLDKPPRAVWFEEVGGSGLDFTQRNGEEADQFTLLESLGAGVGLLDYDRDGRLDVLILGGGYFDGPDKKQIRGHPTKLYRNLGGWKFEDVTAGVGLDKVDWWYTQGIAVADYDRDGWPDFVVTGYGKVALFHNVANSDGSRKFEDVTAKLGLKDDSWAAGAGWGDVNGDGFPDLYVCHYCDWSWTNNPACEGQKPGVVRDICPPQRFKPLVHALFMNDAGKGFRNVAAEHKFEATGFGLGVVLADVNDDRRPDIYVGNDASNNFLFFNHNGKLVERGFAAGVAVDEGGTYDASMGVDVGDFDGTGRAAIWAANYQGEFHALYKNLGRETFQHVSRASGLGAIGQSFVGFGSGFIDADNDGWEDIAIANGHVLKHPNLGSPHKQVPIFMRNVESEGRRFFRSLGATAGPFFTTPQVGRGLAIGDLDNDGWPDLVVCHTNSPVALLRNVVSQHSPAKWVGFRLSGRAHRDVVGSTVIVETDTRTLTKFTKGGGSYLSANDPRVLFGLGPTGVVKRVTVKWSWGEIQTWDNLETDAYWELREGEPVAKKLTAPK